VGKAELTSDDIVVASSCSGGLEMAIGVLANPSHNILLPAPGFTIYQTICDYKGIEPRYYKLKPESNWEADLTHMESLIDIKTSAILVNNPSNPCGSVYSKEHLLAILNLAQKYHLPIISDEIYADVVFEGHTFYSLAALTDTVPVLSVGGISKAYLAPGWRVGWIVIYDRSNLFAEVRVGLLKLSQVILGANTLCQSVVEEALFNTPQAYYDNLNNTLSTNASYLVSNFKKIKGLNPIAPGGAMYMMVGIETAEFVDIKDDVEFAKKLLEEELVFVLPGRIFKFENFVRLVICPPLDKLAEVCIRVEAFCNRHRKAPNGKLNGNAQMLH